MTSKIAVSCNTSEYAGIPPPPTAQQPPSGSGSPHYLGFTITLRHATHGRTPLDV